MKIKRTTRCHFCGARIPPDEEFTLIYTGKYPNVNACHRCSNKYTYMELKRRFIEMVNRLPWWAKIKEA